MQPSPSGTADSTAADRIVDAMARLGRAVAQRHRSDLDQPTFWLMSVICHRGPLRLREVATYAHLDNSTVSRHVGNLEQRGWVVRTPDPTDGRAQLIELSELGRTTLLDAKRQRRELLLQRLSAWTADDIRQLEQLMTRLADEVSDLTDPQH